MLLIANAILFAAQIPPVCGAISVRNEFAAEFQGWYSFAEPGRPQRLELLAVGPDYIASMGTSTNYTHIIKFRFGPYLANVVASREGLTILICSPEFGKHVLFCFPKNHGFFSENSRGCQIGHNE